MADSDDATALPDDRLERVEALLTRIEAHEAEGATINAEMTALGLSSRKVTAIRTHRRTVLALMGIGLEKEAAQATTPRTRRPRAQGGAQ